MGLSNYQNKNWIGFKKDKVVLNISYDKIASILVSQQNLQRAYNPELVIGISRGGIVPASMIASNLSLPLLLISVTRGVEETTWLSPPNDEILNTLKSRKIRVLLVDDIVSSGETIRKSRKFLENLGFKVIVNTIFYDKKSVIIPDIGVCAEQYIKFPWEKKENTIGSLKVKQEKGMSEFHFSDERDSFGFDLDGIFAEDIPSDLYDTNLSYALKMRDNLPLLETAPDIPDNIRPHTAIITARPDLDFERTKKWLDNHGFNNIPLYCRSSKDFGHDLAGHIQSKIKTINELGISCYFESDLIQAVAIAMEVPSIDVAWWNEGNPIIIHAHEFKVEIGRAHV